MTDKRQQHENSTTVNENIAVLDIGSNSFHLLIVNITKTQFNILHKEKFKVGLADGLVNTGIISSTSFALGIQTLKVIKQELAKWPINRISIIATQALRVAKNTPHFISEAQNALPYPIKVIDGEEEGRLIYQGVISLQHCEQSQLVIDIGGASSEFILGKGDNPLLINSLNIGCVSFRNRFFHDDKLSNNNFNAAIKEASKEIQNITSQYKKINWQRCIGTSGSIESILSVLKIMNIGEQITLHNLETLLSQILKYSSIDQLKLGKINSDRTHVFPSGLAILIAIFRTLEINTMEFSSADLGQGVAFELMNNKG